MYDLREFISEFIEDTLSGPCGNWLTSGSLMQHIDAVVMCIDAPHSRREQASFLGWCIDPPKVLDPYADLAKLTWNYLSINTSI